MGRPLAIDGGAHWACANRRVAANRAAARFPLGAQPRAPTPCANRNCISNIRPEGLGYADAAFKIAAMLNAMRTGRISGVRLKDDTVRLLDSGA